MYIDWHGELAVVKSLLLLDNHSAYCNSASLVSFTDNLSANL